MEAKAVVAALAALAQENRLEAFRLLAQAGSEGLAAGAIAERLGIASPTLSFHLAQLRHAGLVQMRREGRSLIYTTNFDAMRALMDFLTANCCAKDFPLRAVAGEAQTAVARHRRKGRAARS